MWFIHFKTDSKHLKNIFDSGELVKEILFIPYWNILQQIA